MLVEPNTLFDENDSQLSILVIRVSLVALYVYSYFKSCCCLNTKQLHHRHRMHVENELAEIMTTGDHEFEEIVEEYEEEILMQEEVLQLPLTDLADTTPA